MLVATHSQEITLLNHFEQGQEQSGDKRIPPVAHRHDVTIGSDSIAARIEDCQGLCGPATIWIEEASNHLPDRPQALQIACRDRLVRQRDMVGREVGMGFSGLLEMVMVRNVHRHASEPVSTRAMARIGDPEQVGDR